jgi:hypothetical protein
MPYDVAWYDEQHTIIRTDIHGHVSWDEWHEAIDKIAEKLAQSPHRVDLIFVDSVGMPRGNPLPHLRASGVRLSRYPNFGKAVTVDTAHVTGFLQVVITALLSMPVAKNFRDRFFMRGVVKTLDEALDLIEKDRMGTLV